MNRRSKFWVAGLLLCVGADAPRRPITVDDHAQIEDVDDPQLSPDGAWVAYTVSTADLESDTTETSLFLSSIDGRESRQLTHTPGGEWAPRFSPDGRWLAFLSGRDDPREAAQVWLLDRAGGEAERLTDTPGGVSDLVWSPDSRALALVVLDPDPEACDVAAKGEAACEEETPKPIVIDRFAFLRDGVGFVRERREHVVRFDLAERAAAPLTSGPFDDALPAWSPDGQTIVFVSKRADADPDRGENWDLYAVDAKAGGTPRPLTTFAGGDANPAWGTRPAFSPDGTQIAYLQGGPPAHLYYEVPALAVVPAGGGAARVVTAALDRDLAALRWSGDGRSVFAVIADDGSRGLARIDVASGRVTRVTAPGWAVHGFDLRGKEGVVLAGNPQQPLEVYRLRGANLTPVSRRNDAWAAGIGLGAVETVHYPSRDGTSITGFITFPPGYQAGTAYPTVLNLHGGPVAQVDDDFDFAAQLLAAHGYVVLSPNPRGSSGRGEAFTLAIFADWGHLDGDDVIAGIDHLIAKGIADPKRLGIGGWSYGGILTNQVIVKDPRFKAAFSGASISNVLAGYGTDQYTTAYEAELGRPWEAPDVWARNSAPFLHADRIRTPTLFLCGEDDLDVPLHNSEQMYQALRSLGVETQLVIYPGQPHWPGRPSYERDLFTRWVGWMDQHLGAP